MSRVFNFSAGPATLPNVVINQIREDLPEYQDSGASMMELSHRGGPYDAVHNEAINNIKTLLQVPDDYSILFMQGGATAQFACLAMNFLESEKTADYFNTGTWAAKAIKEAKPYGNIHIVADTANDIPTRMPSSDAIHYSDHPSYVHITSNETISGAQWQTFPQVPAPLVADMSSDILSRPLDLNQFGLIYAGAQKNLGIAGVALVIIRKDWAEKPVRKLPGIFSYQTMIENNSLYNTAPTFPIYVIALVTRWLLKQGDIKVIAEQNEAKAALLYDVLDGNDFFRPTVVKEFRSRMNVTFRLPTEELEAQFVKEANSAGMSGLKGHRSVGGIRASIYNAMSREGVNTLISFMNDFAKKNSQRVG